MLSTPQSGLPPQRLLPGTLEDRLIGIAGRIAGYVLLVAVASLWISLITWGVTDPSLTHATGGPAQNALGALGAVLSDLMLQTLGFAAVLTLLPPMFWSLELILGERIVHFRSKIAFFPLSVLILSAALSALPVPGGWPLHHGLGGILGDVMFNLTANVLGLVNPDRAGAAAGFIFFATGASALMYSLGLELKDLRELIPSPPRDVSGSWSDNLWAEARRLSGGRLEPVLSPGSGMADPRQPPRVTMPADAYATAANATAGIGPRYDTDDADDGMADAAQFAAPADNPAAAPARTEPARASFWWRSADEPAEKPASPGPSDGRDSSFDQSTERTSRSIAERFAPRSEASAGATQAPPAQATPAGPPPNDAATTRAGARPFGAAFLRGMGEQTRKGAASQYKRPSLNLLRRPAAKSGNELPANALRGTARLLEDVLADFGVKGEIKDIRPGPVVTLFELEPARGTKSSRIIGLADDIARSMSAVSVRVAVVPGRNAIGIELPNPRREGVVLREILESEQYRASEAQLPIALGRSIGGEPVVVDLARMPHLLVAGTTGSGKSVGINAFVLSLLYRHSPEDCRLLMIDPKMLELSVYNNIPHLLAPVVTDPIKAVAALNWAVREMEERYKRMAKLSVRSIDVFNNRVRNANKRGELLARTVQTGFDQRTGEAVYERQQMDLEPMPFIVIVVDEFADLMVVAGKEIEHSVQRLAQMARAAGIHLVMATQRPSVDVVTGTIKANFPTRISFKVASKVDSRTILNEQGAEQLLGQGDMLFSAGSGQMLRVHGAFVSDEEVDQIAQSLREQGAPRYVEGITDGPEGEEAAGAGRAAGGGEEDLYDRAVAVVLRDRKASTSYVQRRLGIGYNRAADLVERMEREGLISAANATGKREILTGPATAH